MLDTVYQNPQIGTPVRLKATMSRPSTKPLTIQQKADMYEDCIVWQPVATNPSAMNLLSPTSQRLHTITWDAARGKWRCSCEAGVDGRDCYHMRCFERNLEWFVMNGNLVIPGKASVYSTAVNKPAGFGESFDARRKADFD